MNETLSPSPQQTEVYRMRIANIVNQLMQDNWAFQERLNTKEIINAITQSMRELFSLNDFLLITETELKRRVGQHMALEGLRGLLSDLSPEQIRAFNEAVARR
jgi:hypothetical protein